MVTQKTAGVVVVGDELLSGKRQDKHLAHVIQVLGPRGMQLAWYRVVGDDREKLAETLQQTQLGSDPVFCFGGIGATPDDQTRQAAADAFGTRLTRHPQAVRLIENQFGKEAYPNRVRMAELPEDCLLIPNPSNGIPGFTLYDHHFFPGFPEMAWPMLDWVLEQYYPAPGANLAEERSVRVIGVRESDLVELMQCLAQRHRDARIFSLPHLGEVNSIEIGFRGERGAIDKALCELVCELNARALTFRFESAA
jgi:molybdopterin-biosynthesis enzyme MoeA-like protein